MGEVEVRIKVKDGAVETFHQLTQASEYDISLAKTELDTISLHLLTYYNKSKQKRLVKEEN